MRVSVQCRHASSAPLPRDAGPIGPPMRSFDGYKNKHLGHWAGLTNKNLYQKLDRKSQFQLIQNRLGGREYQPVDQDSYSMFTQSEKKLINREGHDFDIGKTPVFRNKVASLWDVMDVTGTPYSIHDLIPGKKPNVATFGKSMRPHDTPRRSGQRAPVGQISDFMGTFVNSYIALDCDKWDMDALLDDPETPDSPLQVLQHLTQFLEQRHMLPRRLTDGQIAKVLSRNTTSPESDIQEAYLLAVEKHSPGMLSLGALCKSSPGSTTFHTKQFEKLLSAGIEPSTSAINSLLSAHLNSQGCPVKDSLCLFNDMNQNKIPGVSPNIITYEIIIRILKKNGEHEKVMEIFNSMLDKSIPATTFILNVVLGAVRKLGTFDGCAILCSELCMQDPTILIEAGDQKEIKEQVKLPKTAANNNTFRHLLKQLLSERNSEMNDKDFYTRMLWAIDTADVLLENDTLTYWNQKDMLPLLVHCDELFSSFGDDKFSSDKTASNATLILTALADAFDRTSNQTLHSIYHHLAVSHYRFAASISVNNTPKLFTSVLRIFAAAGDADGASEIMQFLEQTPFINSEHQRLSELALERSGEV